MEILVGPEPAEPPHLILLQVKIDHILYQTFCRTPNVQQNLTLGSREAQKVCKVGFFWHFFFGMSKITAKLFILEEKFCLLKFRSHRDASFTFFERSLRQLSAELS